MVQLLYGRVGITFHEYSIEPYHCNYRYVFGSCKQKIEEQLWTWQSSGTNNHCICDALFITLVADTFWWFG